MFLNKKNWNSLFDRILSVYKRTIGQLVGTTLEVLERDLHVRADFGLNHFSLAELFDLHRLAVDEVLRAQVVVEAHRVADLAACEQTERRLVYQALHRLEMLLIELVQSYQVVLEKLKHFETALADRSLKWQQSNN